MIENVQLIETGQQCPYCLNNTVKEQGQFSLMYICKPCKAWVSVDKSTGLGFGFVANYFVRGKRNDYKALERRLIEKRWFTYDEVNKLIQAKFKQSKANIYTLNSKQLKELIQLFGMFNEIKTNEPFRKSENIKQDLKIHYYADGKKGNFKS